MDDNDIIERFWERSESAIAAVEDRYSKYCRAVAYNILGSAEDAEEVLNDTYNCVWNAIPPERPGNLRAFVAKIARNLSLKRLERDNAVKRGGGQYMLILSELEECIADKRSSTDEYIESEAITAALNRFLSGLSVENRRVFVRRYWRAASIGDIAADFGMSVGKVKSILFRMRNKLREHLESEEIYI